jgi:hypothetical protein
MLIPNPLNTRSFAAPRHPKQPKLFAVPFRLAKSKALLACGSKSGAFCLLAQSLALSQLRSASTRSQKLRMFSVAGIVATSLNTTTKSITILEWIGQLWADDTLETLAEVTHPLSLPLPRFLREMFHDNER